MQFPRDLRYALRQMRHAPLFTLAAAGTLALGIGANTAVFSVVRAVLLRPLPFAQPEQLFVVHEFPVGNPTAPFDISYPDYSDLRAASTTLDALSAFPTTLPRQILEIGDDAQPVHAAWVSGDFFRLLGATAALGRTLGPGDDVAGAPPVAVLSHNAWTRRFGAARDITSRTLRLNGTTYSIVGVMPPGLDYPQHAEIWTALRPQIDAYAQNRTIGFLHVVGRLRPGISRAAAATESDAIAHRLSEQYAPPSFRAAARLLPLGEELLGPARPALLLLTAAALLVLFIACANVSNLLLARGAANRRQLAVRAALGASRGRLTRLLLAESLALAIVGGALGLWLAAIGVGALRSLLPEELYRADAVRVDPLVLLFTAGVALLSAVLFGLVPALRNSMQQDLMRVASRATTGAPTRRLSRAIMAAQLALAVVVLIAGTLVVRSFIRLSDVNAGFDRQGTVTLELFDPDPRPAGPAAVAALFDRLIERASALPGVEHAAGVLLRPLEGPDGYDYPFTIENQPADAQSKNPYLNYEAITPDYFATMGIPQLTGRGFTPADNATSPGVVVVSRAVAERFFPHQDATGRRIKWGGPDSQSPWLTIVGVAGDARYRDLRDVSLNVYVPGTQSQWPLNHLVVHTAGEAGALVPALRQVVREVSPAARAVNIATVSDLISASLRRPRFHTVLLGLFAGLAVVLAALGIFGVIGYLTAHRTAEMGVRMALGAGRGNVLRLVLSNALRTALLGIGAGLGAAFFAVRLLRSLLYDVAPLDPLTFVAVPLALAALALFASWLPARRATRVHPAIALRTE